MSFIYASHGDHRRYRESGHVPDGAVLVKEVFDRIPPEKCDRQLSAVPKSSGLVRLNEDSRAARRHNIGERLWLVVV